MNNFKSTITAAQIPYSLPENWKWFCWGDLIAKYEPGLIRSNNELGGGNVYYLKMGDLDTGGSCSFESLATTHASKEETDVYKLTKGDFLINVRNSMELVGKTCVIGDTENKTILFNHMLVRMKHREQIPSSFVNAFLNIPSSKKLLNRCKQGTTTVIALYKRDLLEIPIPIPDTKTLDCISGFYEALNDKIELNCRINAELEAMAKTLYDYWFVQFDFPDAKDRPYKSSGGKMVYNDQLKRKIPVGWRAMALSELIETDKGGDWGKEQSEGNYTQKVLCIRGADLNGLNGKGEMNPPTRFILKKNLHKLLAPDDLIVEISGGSPTQSTGRLAFIGADTLTRFELPLICSNFCRAISLKKPEQVFYFSALWNSIYENGILFGWEGKTSGIKNLLFDPFVKSYYVAVPCEQALSKFNSVVRPMHSKKQKLLFEAQQLTELRDWLLPMLMNGQVKVS